MPDTLPKKQRTQHHASEALPLISLVDMLAPSFALFQHNLGGVNSPNSLDHSKTWCDDLSKQIKKPVDYLGLGNNPSTSYQQPCITAPIHSASSLYGSSKRSRRYDDNTSLHQEIDFMLGQSPGCAGIHK